MVYFPERRLMYVADTCGYLPGYTPAPLLRSFADRFDELGLDVATILTAHTEPDSLAGFRLMVEAVRTG